MIAPFSATLIRDVPPMLGADRTLVTQKAISHGLTSYGYDISLSEHGFRVFSPIHCQEIDPKNFDANALLDVPLRRVGASRWWSLPPHTYALGVSKEYFHMPRNVLGLCLGKSTYARAGVIINATPLEPEWTGNLVLEISNSADLPVRIYANEGIAQVIFLEGEPCGISYADREGKYQGQTGLTPPRV